MACQSLHPKSSQSVKSESVRLGAIKDILDRAGFKPADKQKIHQVSEFAGWSDEELNADTDE